MGGVYLCERVLVSCDVSVCEGVDGESPLLGRGHGFLLVVHLVVLLWDGSSSGRTRPSDPLLPIGRRANLSFETEGLRELLIRSPPDG